MRRINETDIRKAGLVPGGRPSYKSAIQLFERLSKQHETIVHQRKILYNLFISKQIYYKSRRGECAVSLKQTAFLYV